MEVDEPFKDAGTENPFEERTPSPKHQRITLHGLAAALVLPTCSGTPEEAAVEALRRADALMLAMGRRAGR